MESLREVDPHGLTGIVVVFEERETPCAGLHSITRTKFPAAKSHAAFENDVVRAEHAD